MATFVETTDCRILIDPGSGVGEYRYGLTPHPLERWCVSKHRERIRLFAEKADVVVITHYHLNHFSMDDVGLYRNKMLLLKNTNQKIDVNQRKRAFAFLKFVGSAPAEMSYVDGRTIRMGETRIVFSDPVPHGSGQHMETVIQAAVHEGEESFLFSSDVQGPCSEEPVDFILRQNPNILYLDGPATYMRRDSSLEEPLDRTLARMESIILKTKVHTVIMDHHLLRDAHWMDWIEPLFSMAHKRGIRLQTAAAFRGEADQLLEARRNQLYEDDSPSDS